MSDEQAARVAIIDRRIDSTLSDYLWHERQARKLKAELVRLEQWREQVLSGDYQLTEIAQ